MKLRTEGAVYLVGIAILGIFYYQLKALASRPVLLIGPLVYLIALRVLGRYLAKKWGSNVADGDGDA